MGVVVVTPPVHGIDLALVKAHLREESNDYDALISAYIDAAVAHIDGPQGWLGRSIWTQTLELRQNTFSGAVSLPYGPVRSVTSVIYVDSVGTEQTLAVDQYMLTNDGLIRSAHNTTWPSLRGDAEGVRVRYVAGFATVPAAVHASVLLMVGDMYAFRETAEVGAAAGKIPVSATVENLLSPYRNWRV